MNKKKALVVAETTSWYDKKGELTFTDIILAVRRSLWSIRFSKSENGEDSLKIINQNTKYILDQLALAAYLPRLEPVNVVRGPKWIPAMWVLHSVYRIRQRVRRQQAWCNKKEHV